MLNRRKAEDNLKRFKPHKRQLINETSGLPTTAQD